MGVLLPPDWTIEGDERCHKGGSYTTELKLSACKEGEFTCNAGKCVNMSQRCNQIDLDCTDKSDEENCNILVLGKGYNKFVPPVKGYDPIDVYVSLDVLKLVDIDEEDYSIEIQFEINMKWSENRVTYNNLKAKDSLNALMQNDIEKLWLPKVIYENTDQKETTRLGENWEWETRVVVKKEGRGDGLKRITILDETEFFMGNENNLSMTQTYTQTFQCAYQLSRYPFDTQVNLMTISALCNFCPDLLY